MNESVEAIRAWSLARGMARHTGLELPRCVLEGRLSRDELSKLVTRCQKGGCAEDCQRWLATARMGSTPPEFCVIRNDLAALAPRK